MWFPKRKEMKCHHKIVVQSYITYSEQFSPLRTASVVASAAGGSALLGDAWDRYLTPVSMLIPKFAKSI
jgi:hypothetical protein